MIDRVLFLDIDGVLNEFRWGDVEFRADRFFKPSCVEQLNRIIDETYARM